MTDEEDDDIDYGDEDSENSGFFRWLQTVVVVFALCGFFGLAWYAYKSGDTVEDKDVELIKVDKTPIKEAPANPGGMEIPNQDKTVYGLIDGSKTDKPVVERIMPAPEEPVKPENESEAWMSSKLRNKESGEKKDPAVANAPTVKEVGKEETPKTEQFNPDNAPKEKDGAAADTAPILDASKATPSPAPAEQPKAEKPADAPAPAKEPAKKVEEEDNTQDDADEKPAAAAPAASPASSAALPKIRVQLAALPSQEEANKTWQRLLKKFPSELSDKKNYVVRVTVKGKVYYRLQVGPLASAHAAENLCMTMISTGQACIVAK